MRIFLILLATALVFSGCHAAPEQNASDVLPSSSLSTQMAEPTAPPAVSKDVRPPQAAAPVLLTSLGQSTDVLLVREMLVDLKVAFDYNELAQPEEVSPYATVVLAVGASVKALGGDARGMEQEQKRCEALLQALAPEQTVVMVRMGDSATQSTLTTQLVEAALAHADAVLVTQSSDKSASIRKAAEHSGIWFQSAATMKQMEPLLDALFSHQ